MRTGLPGPGVRGVGGRTGLIGRMGRGGVGGLVGRGGLGFGGSVSGYG
ncbi:hypothetical protein H1164_11895 [Thermoactinomyces daqus]|uniref:Uncharacterized protein n=1 Tax=Thermoactinomyces daqus TaxID=1329516 RepID=A0A7W1XBN4_9BACL|nr:MULTISPECIES: hypothetical protein [Thermoactinomyces]MBA4543593.1 hypothetical protein [Thermoactinomyces daqus]